MPFIDATRLRKIILPTLTAPATGGTLSVDLPKVGIAHRLDLVIACQISGTVTGPNAYGQASAINRVRVALNAGLDVFNVSGPGYHWLTRDFLDLYGDALAYTTARAAVAVVGPTPLDMIIPLAINQRDEWGYIMLQNEQTLATLYVTFEAPAIIATGGPTVVTTVVPILYYFEVPNDPKDWPRFDTVHQILEDDQTVPGAGLFTYNWLRGNTYLGVYHLMPPARTWTTAQLRAQQGNIIQDEVPGSMHMLMSQNHNRDMTLLAGGPLAGINQRLAWDFMGTDGLGAFGSRRDLIDSSRLTDIASVINISGAGVLKTQRRQIVALGT